MSAASTRTTMDAADPKTALESERPPVLINALPREAHEAKHIPGSVNVPVDDIEQVKTLVPNTDEPIVVYCANADCDASPTATRMLEGMGYTSVVDFEDGYAGWRRAGFPLVGSGA
ncbi:MAG: rhodanese-like domain-containing protein [Salinivenus sp.]